MSGRQKPCICVVDDDDAVRHSLDLYLSMKGMEVCSYGGGKQLLDDEKIYLSHLFILDIHMPEMDGFLVLQELRSRGIDAPAILMSGLGDQQIEARAEGSGVAAFFNKPIDPKTLLDTVIELIESPLE
jgi:FixJ family two-component response regulator